MTTNLQEKIARLGALSETQQDALAHLIQSMLDEQEDIASMLRGFADLAAGRLHSHEEVWAEWDKRQQQTLV